MSTHVCLLYGAYDDETDILGYKYATSTFIPVPKTVGWPGFIEGLTEFVMENNIEPDEETDGAWHHLVWSIPFRSTWDVDNCREIVHHMKRHRELARTWAFSQQIPTNPSEYSMAEWYAFYDYFLALFERAVDENAWVDAH